MLYFIASRYYYERLFYCDITSLLRMGCFTITLRFYYEEVVLLRHHVSTTNELFYYDITSLLRRGCFTTALRHYVTTTNGLFYYDITSLLRMGCFTTTLRYYYAWVVYGNITLLLRMGCLRQHYDTTTQGLCTTCTTLRNYYNMVMYKYFTVLLRMVFASTCLFTVMLHFYYNYYFCAMFWLLLLLGNSAKFRKPLGIKKGVRLYFVFPRIHRSWLVNLFWKSYWRGLRRLVASMLVDVYR